MTCKTRIKPIVPSEIIIDSQARLRNLHKHHRSTIHSLKLEGELFSIDENHTITSILLRIIKKVKFTSKLHFHKLNRYLAFKGPYGFKIAKHFRDTQAISVYLSLENLPNNIKWLALAKKLKSIDYQMIREYDWPQRFQRNLEKLFLSLKQMKLEKLKLGLGSLIYDHIQRLLASETLPVTLRRLNIDYGAHPVDGEGPVFNNNKTVLSNLTNLESLRLNINLKVNVLKSLFDSLPNYDKLAHLDAVLKNIPASYQKTLDFKELLDNFNFLQTIILSTQECLLTNVLSLEKPTLRRLELDLHPQGQQIITSLSHLFINLKDLEYLKLAIKGPNTSTSEQSQFFQQLSQLVHLRSVSLNFIGAAAIMQSLVECVDKWPNLQDLELKRVLIDCNHIGLLLEALRRRAVQLRTLKINFENQPLHSPDLKLILKLIEETKHTEHLGLDNILFSGKEFLNRLKGALAGLRHLASFSLCSKASVDTEAFRELVKMVSRKRGFESLHSFIKWKQKLEKMKEVETELDLQEVVRKNPYIKKIETSLQDVNESIISAVKWDKTIDLI